MSESRPKKYKIEFIESYLTGGEFGSDYQWNDNHGELIRCKDCKHWMSPGIGYKNADLGRCMGRGHGLQESEWFCADGERRTN